MTKITIDQIDINAHERYARDQIHLDRKIIQDAGAIPQQSEVLTTYAIYFSFWEKLFEWSSKNLPWASFMPPSKYFAQKTRCFAYQLIPAIQSEEDNQEEGSSQEEGADDSSEDERKALLLKEMKEKILNLEAKADPKGTVEQDKMTLIKLFDTVADLNGILKEVYSKKLQYQKG